MNLFSEKLPKSGHCRVNVNAIDGMDARPEREMSGLNYCVEGYNFALENGKLVPPMGLERGTVTTPTGKTETLWGLNDFMKQIMSFYHFRNSLDGDLMIMFGGNRLYQMSFSTGNTVRIESIPAIEGEVHFLQYYFQGKETLLIFLENGGMYTYDGRNDAAFYPDVPGMTSVCMHYHRVYGVDGENTLYFSDDLNPTNWQSSSTEGGYIRLMDEGGKLHTVLRWKDYLFLFREHSVHRLIAYTDQSDFQLTKVYTSESRIIKNTISVCDDFIVFWSDRFYRFDGFNLTPFFEGLTPLIESTKYAYSTYFDRKYFFACTVKRTDGDVGDENVFTENNALFALHRNGKDFAYLRGTDVRCMAPFVRGEDRELFVAFRNFRAANIARLNDKGKIFNQTLRKKFVSAWSDFGDPSRQKTVRTAYIKGKYPMTFAVETENGVWERQTEGKADRAERVEFKATGERMRYRLETDADAIAVQGITFDTDFIRRYYADGSNS